MGGPPVMPGLLIAKALASAEHYGSVPPFSSSMIDDQDYQDRRALMNDRRLHGKQLADDNPVAALASIPLAFGYEGVKALALQKHDTAAANVGKAAIRRVGEVLGTTSVSPEFAQDPEDQKRLWTVDNTTRPASAEAAVAYTRGVLQALALRAGGH